MVSDKELKKEFRKKASKDYNKHYPVKVLKKYGFERKKCKKCNDYFWTTENKTLCGDSACVGGYSFINDSPVKKPLGYIETWKKFATVFKKLGYEPIKRYPVAARWRDDTDFVQASIYNFQPYVVSGEIEPPAKKLVVPQFCLRFNDIDNVGITGAHYTGFVMIGQHAFMPPKEYDQEQYFADIHTWLTKGFGLPTNEITYKEDVWAGGGNFGPSMEYFSRGLELGNQVYMFYEKTRTGSKDLKLKVLDMGTGQERYSWFSHGTSTSYETTFPDVVKKLQKITGVTPDKALMAKFLPYASYLNIDEVQDIDRTWNFVAKKTGLPTKELKEKILPLSAMYSVAEHSRSLLVAITDGVLPSNVKGGYNLRVILRRALSFIERQGWQVDMADVCKWHARYLKPQFPELNKNLDEVYEILDSEKKKFKSTRKRSKKMVSEIVKKKITKEKLIELYTSKGITPEQVKEESERLGKKVKVPDDFYAQVAALHEKQKPKEEKKKLNFGTLTDTEILYYKSYDIIEAEAIVLKTLGNNVVLNRTVFYPTSGGQLHDTGTINREKVVDVFRQDNVIVHLMDKKSKFKKGDMVALSVDFDRRLQLAQHHTATHILNGVCKKLLGNHIWQAGASKQMEKARLDITHYEALTKDQLRQIEKEANKIISDNIPVYSLILPRDVAEKKYGFTLYQGGYVPGKKIRVVDIRGLDVEACGGTHLHLTGVVERINILRSSKISDGVVRIEFTAGPAARKSIQLGSDALAKAASLLDCEPKQVPGRTAELFKLWKQIVKKKKDVQFKLNSKEESNLSDKELVEKAAEILKTQPEYVSKTIERFLDEIKSKK